MNSIASMDGINVCLIHDDEEENTVVLALTVTTTGVKRNLRRPGHCGHWGIDNGPERSIPEVL